MKRTKGSSFAGVLIVGGLLAAGCGSAPPEDKSTIDSLTADEVQRLLKAPDSELDPELLEVAVRALTSEDERLLAELPELDEATELDDLFAPPDPSRRPPPLSKCAGGVAHGKWKPLQGDLGVFYGTLRDRSRRAVGVMAGVYGFGRIMGLAVSKDDELRFGISGTYRDGNLSLRLLDDARRVVGKAGGSYEPHSFVLRWARYCHEPCEVECAPGSIQDPSGACRCVPIPCRRGQCPAGMYCDTCPTVCGADAEVCVAVCGPPVCRPKHDPEPKPEPGKCRTVVLGGKDTTCRPAELWRRHARAECEMRGQVLTQFSPAIACGRELSRSVKFECCDPKDPPPPPPPPPACRAAKVGYDGRCMAMDGWIVEAERTCYDSGLVLGKVTGSSPCRPHPGPPVRSGIAWPPLLPGGLTFECCKGDDPPPPPPPPPGCITRGQGGDSSCKPANLWREYAAEDCAKQGLELGRIDYGDACPDPRTPNTPSGSADLLGVALPQYRAVKYQCCKSDDPPPVPCREVPLKADGCVTADELKQLAHKTCVGRGLSLRELIRLDPCGPRIDPYPNQPASEDPSQGAREFAPSPLPPLDQFGGGLALCCGEEPPQPPPPPPPCFASQLGRAGQCQPESAFRDEAEKICAGERAKLEELVLGEPCKTAAGDQTNADRVPYLELYATARYTCCGFIVVPPPPPEYCFGDELGNDGTCELESTLRDKAQAICGESRAKLTEFAVEAPCRNWYTNTPDAAGVPYLQLFAKARYACCGTGPLPPPPPPPCEPMDAQAEGLCKMMLRGIKFDGKRCVPLGGGCRCVGSDCHRLFETVAECEKAYAQCIPPKPECPDSGYICELECAGKPAPHVPDGCPLPDCGCAPSCPELGQYCDLTCAGKPEPYVPAGCDIPDCGCAPSCPDLSNYCDLACAGKQLPSIPSGCPIPGCACEPVCPDFNCDSICAGKEQMPKFPAGCQVLGCACPRR